MNTSIYSSFMSISMPNFRKKAIKNTTPLRLKVEPWAFDTIREHFSKSNESDFHLIMQNLYDCILKLKPTEADKILLGTEIMINFTDAILIFEVKYYSHTIIQNQVEKLYVLDLSKIEKKRSYESFLKEIEKNKEYYY
jgi:hypothetical protein